MARVTIEDCLEKVENRFSLIHMAAERVRQLKDGDVPLVRSKNREIVTALREIAAGRLVAVPRPSGEGKPTEMKEEKEVESVSALKSGEELEQAIGGLEVDAVRPQRDPEYSEPAALEKVPFETPEETLY